MPIEPRDSWFSEMRLAGITDYRGEPVATQRLHRYQLTRRAANTGSSGGRSGDGETEHPSSKEQQADPR